MDPTWAEAVVDDCAAADVAVYVKQDSGALPGRQGRLSPELWRHKAVPR
jgi:protein gp37